MAFHKAKVLQAAEKSLGQGKIVQAIKHYQEILDHDPSDLSLLNTIGDLYIRERNITEGLRQFYKLAEAYVREGFNLKAIAIYRKIFKVDPNSVEPLLRLAELYQLQGLGREARELYLQAVEAFKKRNQGDRALETLGKLVQYDPENISFRNRLAAECEHQGRAQDAAHAYLESAEILIRRGDQVGAEQPLKRAAELDPKNLKTQTLSAHVAMACGKPQQAQDIINSSPELRADPAAKHILLNASVALRKFGESKALAREVFDSNPIDFTPISTVSAFLVENGVIDEASQLIESVVEPLLSQNRDGTLLESLTLIWNSAPNHLPTLELIRRLSERTGNKSTLAEVLEALARVHVQAGDLEKAEQDYLQLIEREPDHHYYRGLLNSVQRKLGKTVEPVEFSPAPRGVADEAGPAAKLTGIDARQESMVQEGLANSDLFLRYNLPGKAIAELEKVLQVYPERVELHQRVLEISRNGFSERGAAAATELARIFANRGDVETSSRYQAMTATGSAPQAFYLPPAFPEKTAEIPLLPLSEEPETRATQESADSPYAATPCGQAKMGEPTPAPSEILFDLTPAAVSVEPSLAPPVPFEIAEPPKEFDLAEEFEALTAGNIQAPSILAPDATPTPLGESQPAGQLLGSSIASPLPPVAESAAKAGVFAEELDASPTPREMEPALAADLEESRIEVEFYLDNGFVDEARQVLAELDRKFAGNSTVTDLWSKFLALATESPGENSMEDRAGLSTEAAITFPRSASPTAHVAPQLRDSEGMTEMPGILGELAGDVASSLEDLAAPQTAPSRPQAGSPALPPAEPAYSLKQLSGLLAEIDGVNPSSSAHDDPEKHYNQGVAFRQMGLWDEAIDEFQRVVKGAGEASMPANFIQACTLLAMCFMQKNLPAVAVKWYLRALETPGLDEGTQLALEYDLGVAYEQTGNLSKALERYTEVYSLNIDFRDVADKVRDLQRQA